MISRIAVYQKVPDTRATVRQKSFSSFSFHKKIKSITLVDVYTVEKKLSDVQLEKVAEALINPVTEYAKIRIEGGKEFFVNEIAASPSAPRNDDGRRAKFCRNRVGKF